jgi:hypothetical protein
VCYWLPATDICGMILNTDESAGGEYKVLVNTKKWYWTGTDLWAELVTKYHSTSKTILRGFGKRCLRLAMCYHSAKGLFAFLK